MEQSLHISKLDSAKRQLDVAIRLYFFSDDPVSTHTLASAAYNVIRDVTAQRTGPRMLVKDTLTQMLRPEAQELFRRKLNEAENFFKHADRDHDSTFEFFPGLTELFLLDACDQYYRLTGEATPSFKLFRGWFAANHPEFFDLSRQGGAHCEKSAEQIVAMGRATFFATFIPREMRLQI